MLLTLLIIPLTITGFDNSPLEISSPKSPSMMGYGELSRMEYFLTQYRVFATYIRLLLLPVGQSLCHDYPVYRSFAAPGVLLSFLFFSSLLCLAVYMVFRSKDSLSALRLPAYGILWFFLTLSVESTIIPLPMVINEYRLYLPSVGAFLAIVGSVFFIAEKFKEKQNHAIAAAITILALVTVVLQTSTYARNRVWKSSITLWEDVVRKSPLEPRGHNNLAMAYESQGLTDEAIKHFQSAVVLMPENSGLHKNLASAYWSGGMKEKAILHYEKALKLSPRITNAHINLGIIYCETGRLDEAIEHFMKALDIDPNSSLAYNNLGIAYRLKGHDEEAIKNFRTALLLTPDSEEAHYNLGYVYFIKGLIDKAHREFDTVLTMNPDNQNARSFHDEIHYNGQRSAQP
jgi:tetratricopeptide (TPR) repeat protein